MRSSLADPRARARGDGCGRAPPGTCASSSGGLPAGGSRVCNRVPGGAAISQKDCDAAPDGSRPSAKRARFHGPGTSWSPTPAESRLSLEVSKAISTFARYPHRRPVGLCPHADGSLNVSEIWNFWGRFHGVSKNVMLQYIAEHAFHASGRRRFLLRSDSAGQTWVTVVQRPQRFCQRRQHRRRGLASQTLDSGEVDFEGDTTTLLASKVPGAVPRNLDVGQGNDKDGATGTHTLESGDIFSGQGDVKEGATGTQTLESGDNFSLDDAVSISSGLTPGSSEVKSEPALAPPSPPTLLCKDEEVFPSSSESLACAPVPDTPGLLDGFSFLFAETDNLGCPVVPGGDDLSPFSDTVPASFVDTLVDEDVDQLPTAKSESPATSDHGAPCPGAPTLVRRVPDEHRDIPVPPGTPPLHSPLPSTPHACSRHFSPLPAPGWSLKVTLDQDTRRMPLHCTGTPPFPDVLSGVCTLFHLTPFDPAAGPFLFYRDSDGDNCTLTHTTYHDALPLFSATRIIRLSLAATHLSRSSPSTPSPVTTSRGPVHFPSHTPRYSPPAHAVAGLSRDQLLLSESRRRDLDQATAHWKAQYRDNPCSTSALRALHDIFPNDSAGGLAVLHSCAPARSPGSRNPTSTPSVVSPPRQCSVPGAWSAGEILSATQWIMGNPGLSWSPTPGAGGHKQIRIKNAIVNHWNSGVVNVQGRHAQLVSEKLLSTRQVSGLHSLGTNHGWSFVSRRRNRFPPSASARTPSPDCGAPGAPSPSSPTLHHFPSDLSHFSALSPHDQELPDPPPPSLTPSHHSPTDPSRHCPETLTATSLLHHIPSDLSRSSAQSPYDQGLPDPPPPLPFPLHATVPLVHNADAPRRSLLRL